VSKNVEDEQYVWESTADDTFKIAEDPRGSTLGRGTEITLFLKDDASQFLDQSELQSLIERYSEFITFPIYLHTSREESYEVEIEDEDVEEDEDDSADELDELKAEDAESEEDEKPKTRTETKTVWEWTLVNSQKAIWTRSKDELTDEDYNGFYKSISKDVEDPLSHIHFMAEGEIEFRSIMYVPSKMNTALLDNYYQSKNELKLYVKKVMIADQLEDLLPRYLNFIQGVVDSDDLPLNVSRETLQQHKVLKVMGKKLTRKVLEMLRQLVKESEEEKDQVEEEVEEPEEGKEVIEDKKVNKYLEFWKEFGKNIKLGVIEDESNKTRLSKLLRFHTSTLDEGEFTSLEGYVERMKEWQTDIYFITGETIETVEKSSFMEKFTKKNVEVLYLVDPLDEYLASHLGTFDSHKLVDITKEGLKFGDEGDEEERRLELYKENYTPLTKFLKDLLGSKVSKVIISDNLESVPSMLVTSQFGYSANMERIMKAQTFGDNQKNQFMMSKKTMAINPRHPIVDELLKEVEVVEDDEVASETKDLAWLLFDTALLNSGFTMDDPEGFAKRMYRLMQKGLSLETLELLDPIEVPEPEEEEEDEDFEDNDDDEETEDLDHDEL
jgi:heat shock protein beta